jgi:hypothetical protein
VLQRGVARARRVVVLLGDHEVDVAEAQRRQRLLGLRLRELAVERGVPLLQRPEGRDDERVRRRLEGGDAQPAGDLPGRLREIGLGCLQARQHRVGVDDKTAARLRELNAAADALEQRHAGIALEGGELLGHGRGRVGERLGDGRHRPASRELPQEAQATDIEHRSAVLSDALHAAELTDALY